MLPLLIAGAAVAATVYHFAKDKGATVVSGTHHPASFDYEVQTNYGYGDGWEVSTTEADMVGARARLKEYRANQPQYPHRIIKRRVKAPTVSGSRHLLSQREVAKLWRDELLWQIPHVLSDDGARREAFVSFVDSLHRDGRISAHVAQQVQLPALTKSDKAEALRHSRY